jgi:glycosyltransferase involved in cell wall biosynthesis
MRRDGLVNASPEAFAAEVERLWDDEGERSRLADSGRSRWLEEFTWDRIAERYEEVYVRAAESG